MACNNSPTFRKLKPAENLSDLVEGERILIHNLGGISQKKEISVFLGKQKTYSIWERQDLFPFVFVSRQHESRLMLHYLFNEEGHVAYGQWRTKEWGSRHYHTFSDKRVCDSGKEEFDKYNALLLQNNL